MLKKLIEKPQPTFHKTPPSSVDEYYIGSPLARSRPDALSTIQTHKSKYTSTSKLTQSQLYRTLSGTDLRDRNQEVLRCREMEVEVLGNMMDSVDVSQRVFVWQMGQLCEKFAILATNIRKQLIEDINQ